MAVVRQCAIGSLCWLAAGCAADDSAADGGALTSVVASSHIAGDAGDTGQAGGTPSTGGSVARAASDGMALVWGYDAGLCVAAANGLMVAGNTVTLSTCDGSLSQQWQMQDSHFCLQGNLCMYSSDFNVPVKLAVHAADNNQRFLYQGAIMLGLGLKNVYGLGIHLLAVQDANHGSYTLQHRQSVSGEDGTRFRFSASSTPRERGYLIRPDVDPNVCLRLENSTVDAVPCVATDVNQRWLLETGLLTSLANLDVCVVPPVSGSTFAIKARSAAALGTDGFWIGESGDLPSLSIPTGASVYSDIYYDPSAKAVTYRPSSVKPNSWTLGGIGTP